MDKRILNVLFINANSFDFSKIILSQILHSYNPQKVVMIEAQAQQEKLSPDQDGGDDIEAAARWNPLSQQPEQTLQLR